MGQNALFHAITGGNLQTVEYLLLKGANWHHIDNVRNFCELLDFSNISSFYVP